MKIILALISAVAFTFSVASTADAQTGIRTTHHHTAIRSTHHHRETQHIHPGLVEPTLRVIVPTGYSRQLKPLPGPTPPPTTFHAAPPRPPG